MQARISEALARTRALTLVSQERDGSWRGAVESDPRATAFYLCALWNLGRGPDQETREMESYLAAEQLDCGGWPAHPGGAPDVDVSTICTFALQIADTARGAQARSRAQAWLAGQAPPAPDSFWQGFLALNGELAWTELPYLSPRIVTNRRWVRPTIYDFSFLRIAVVAASILQVRQAAQGLRERREAPESKAFSQWKDRWVEACRQPIPGWASWACEVGRAVDKAFPVEGHARAAVDWLLAHQEEDGSFFASVHMTSIAIVALQRFGGAAYSRQVEAGLAAMRRWQVRDSRGRRQQFTDSTTWDTLLSLDLAVRLGTPPSDPQVRAARDYVLEAQNPHLGDWSHRVKRPRGGSWGFQRVGRWYPDNDDTVMAVSALLALQDPLCVSAVRDGVEWLLGMQGSDGGWASWDRDDRSWVAIPGGGPWFARDLPSAEITARIVVLLSRLGRNGGTELGGAWGAARKAMLRGAGWLRRNHVHGRWFGRWFTHYLYGTCHALEALVELGQPRDEALRRQSRLWLTGVANSDGGFGEAAASADEGRFVTAPSTPFHTACGLIGLIHAGAAAAPAADRAALWLLEHQDADGRWTNRDFFAAGVPGLWYANFELTPTYFAAKALALFTHARVSGPTLARR